jgi:hypothetical protein
MNASGGFNHDLMPDDDEDGPFPWDEQPDGVYCSDCGEEITEAQSNNGQKWTVEAIKGFSEKKYGRCLCPSCQRKASKGGRQ